MLVPADARRRRVHRRPRPEHRVRQGTRRHPRPPARANTAPNSAPFEQCSTNPASAAAAPASKPARAASPSRRAERASQHRLRRHPRRGRHRTRGGPVSRPAHPALRLESRCTARRTPAYTETHAGSRSPSRTRSPPSSRRSGDGVLDACASGSAARSRCAATGSRSRATSRASSRRAPSSTSSSSSSRAATQIGPDTVGAVLGALDQAEDIRDVFDDVVWRHRGKKIAPKTVNQKRYVDAIRRCTVTFGDRPGRHRQDVPRDGARGRGALRARGRPHHPHAPRGRGRRAARLPARATCSRRSTRTCARSSTRSTTCWTPTGSRSYMERGTIEVAPLAFMRGRTLNDSFIILDEAQNTTPEQMQMFLTRLGFGSKMVVTGDVTQIDLPREQASGLIQVQHILGGDRRDRVRRVRARGRRPAQARAADRRGVQAARRGDRHRAPAVVR